MNPINLSQLLGDRYRILLDEAAKAEILRAARQKIKNHCLNATPSATEGVSRASECQETKMAAESIERLNPAPGRVDSPAGYPGEKA